MDFTSMRCEESPATAEHNAQVRECFRKEAERINAQMVKMKVEFKLPAPAAGEPGDC